jgi:hypothetical protein
MERKIELQTQNYYTLVTNGRGIAGKVNIGQSTYKLVKETFPCTYRSKIQTKNKGEIDMYFVENN